MIEDGTSRSENALGYRKLLSKNYSDERKLRQKQKQKNAKLLCDIKIDTDTALIFSITKAQLKLLGDILRKEMPEKLDIHRAD